MVRQKDAELNDGGIVVDKLREIAIAARNSASASTDLPVCASKEPKLLWEPARILRNPVRRGCRPPASVAAPAPCGTRPPPRPASPSATAGCRCDRSCPPVRSGPRSSPRRGGQRLLIGPRQSEGFEGIGRLARRGQEGADPRRQAARAALEVGAGGDVRASSASSASALR